MNRKLVTLDPLEDREIRILRNEDRNARRLCVILDAEFYLDRFGAVDALNSTSGNKDFDETDFVFVSHVDSERRHHGYCCSDDFAAQIAIDLMGSLIGRFPSLQRSGNLVCGLSLSGLASAHIKMMYPRVFSGALCQSGSFWWNQEWLTTQTQHGGSGRFWISVGSKETDFGISHPPTGLRQEVSQIDACRRFADSLKRSEYEVTFRVYEGGHDFPSWKSEFLEALAWLLK